MRSPVKSLTLKLLLASLLLPASLPAAAQEQPASAQQASEAGATAAPGDGSAVPDVVDEDFVIASLLISDPGGALYSRLGHAAIRMQCPTHNLDYVFSYTAEDILKNPLKFFSGKLKMGLMAISPEDYLSDFRDHGRGVKEYTLNLPIDVKRNLWRVLDDHMMEGSELEFDFIRRGCAHSTLMFIKEGLGDNKLRYGAWPKYFEGASRREITCAHLKEHRWTELVLHFICNGIIDHVDCSNEQKVIIPADLPVILSAATVDGVSVIDSEAQQIIPSVWKPSPCHFSPMLVALLLLLLTLLCAFLRSAVMDYVLLGIQSLLGVFALWLFFSPLVCTEWSWLIIPFNPLPLIFWRWRRHWALPYAIVLLVWCAFMFFWPHLLTDRAYVVVTIAIMASYINNSCRTSKGSDNG